jgi:hypothetical protein
MIKSRRNKEAGNIEQTGRRTIECRILVTKLDGKPHWDDQDMGGWVCNES